MRSLNLTRQDVQSLLGVGVGVWVVRGFGGLNHDRLRVLCSVFGLSGSGSKVVLSGRLDAAVRVRTLMSDFEWGGVSDVELWRVADSFASRYTFRVLSELCRDVGVGSGRNKVAMALKLLRWRRDCRIRGASAVSDFNKWIREEPYNQLLKIQ